MYSGDHAPTHPAQAACTQYLPRRSLHWAPAVLLATPVDLKYKRNYSTLGRAFGFQARLPTQPIQTRRALSLSFWVPGACPGILQRMRKQSGARWREAKQSFPPSLPHSSLPRFPTKCMVRRLGISPGMPSVAPMYFQRIMTQSAAMRPLSFLTKFLRPLPGEMAAALAKRLNRLAPASRGRR